VRIERLGQTSSSRARSAIVERGDPPIILILTLPLFTVPPGLFILG